MRREQNGKKATTKIINCWIRNSSNRIHFRFTCLCVVAQSNQRKNEIGIDRMSIRSSAKIMSDRIATENQRTKNMKIYSKRCPIELMKHLSRAVPLLVGASDGSSRRADESTILLCALSNVIIAFVSFRNSRAECQVYLQFIWAHSRPLRSMSRSRNHKTIAIDAAVNGCVCQFDNDERTTSAKQITQNKAKRHRQIRDYWNCDQCRVRIVNSQKTATTKRRHLFESSLIRSLECNRKRRTSREFRWLRIVNDEEERTREGVIENEQQ